MTLQEQLCDWENVRLAYQNASRGKRGLGPTFAWRLAKNSHFRVVRRVVKGLPRSAAVRGTTIEITPVVPTATETNPTTSTTTSVFVWCAPHHYRSSVRRKCKAAKNFFAEVYNDGWVTSCPRLFQNSRANIKPARRLG